MSKTLLQVVFALALLCASSLSAQSAEKPMRTIAVNGSATVYVVPDVTVVTFGVENFDSQLASAIAQNRTSAASLVKAVKGLGIDEKNISTDNLEVQIEYAYDNGRVKGTQGYRVKRTYMVKLADARQLERVVEVGLDSGANQLMGIDFQTSDLEKYRDEARVQAVTQAKEKALLMARELGVKVGRPMNIQETGDGYVMPMRAGRGMMAMAKMADASAAPGETLPLGQMQVQAGVSVVFELE